MQVDHLKDKRRFLEVRPISQGTDDLDMAFWQAEGPPAIFSAAWELVLTAHAIKGGRADELRLQRPTVVVRKAPG